MFHFDLTCEDSRVIADEITPHSLRVRMIDNHSGKEHTVSGVEFCLFEKLVAGMICCHGDIDSEVYPALEELLKDCPNECRPIP